VKQRLPEKIVGRCRSFLRLRQLRMG
jgi:hypothetical protein